MSEANAPEAFVERAKEVYLQRDVSRLVDRTKHQKGMNVANFMGDLTSMLMDGEYYEITPKDLKLLAHLHRTAVRPAENHEGAIVSMCGRHWGAFVGIRRTYLAAKRNPQNLGAYLRATRATA